MSLISTPMLSEESSLSGTLSKSYTTRPLAHHEQFWAESYEFLLSRGYQLRPRYRPEWVPSWIPKRHPIGDECDDFLISYKTDALDALCIKDNQKVVLKRVNGNELKILRHLDALRSDTRNHTIPLLDVIPFPGTDWMFVAMPYCRLFNSPPFHCRDEFVDAMTQYIEGLQFMHEHNVVHLSVRCLCLGRIWLSKNHASFPKARTGAATTLTPAFPGTFSPGKTAVRSVPPVQYYYIDFGLSKHFPGGKESARLMSTLRTFPMIPELSLTVPYNPFYVDVFQLGLAMSRIIDDYPALENFRIVAASLTVDDPHARATLEDALKQLSCVRPDAVVIAPEANLGEWYNETEEASSFTLARVISLGARQDDSNTTAPLTITQSLEYPTQPGTAAAISSAYVAYAQACGPEISRAIQDGLEQYNAIAFNPTTNTSDPKFLLWLSTQDPDYMTIQDTCSQDQLHLQGLVDDQTTPPLASAPGPTTTAEASGGAAPGHTPSSTPNSTPSAPRTSPSTGTGKVDGPSMLMLLWFSTAGIWAM
ncbi:hypothetical protein B0H11DRAFT_2214852 [Mycena galericulata]|nr:hypothetical protein B0H11DRAFT_2214852 [Mycena galericulata]